MVDNPPLWTSDEVDSIEAALSAERFARYLGAASSKPDALEFYAWNTALSSAFHGPLQCLEVGLRNCIHARLSETHGASWFKNTVVLRANDISLVAEAEQRVNQTGKELTPGRVVAELSFGFWVGLFANAYDGTIWRTDLYRLFSPRPKRHELHGDLDRLRTLRNRIAHHEPIFQRTLTDDYDRIRRVLRSFAPTLADWMEFHSRVLDVIASGPQRVQRF
jgi:hypothetical protein